MSNGSRVRRGRAEICPGPRADASGSEPESAPAGLHSDRGNDAGIGIGATTATFSAFDTQLLERARAMPGVTDASLSDCAPLSGGCNATGLVRPDAPGTFFPGEDPIGKHVTLGVGGLEDAQVIGIVGGVCQRADSPPMPEAYTSYLQSPRSIMIVFVRGRNAASLAP